MFTEFLCNIITCIVVVVKRNCTNPNDIKEHNDELPTDMIETDFELKYWSWRIIDVDQKILNLFISISTFQYSMCKRNMV